MKPSAALILPLLVLVACDDPSGPPRVHHTSCDAAEGVTHSGTGTNALWKAADGPHRLSGTVAFDTLEIQAGTLVCGRPGAILEANSLIAIGTAEAPIVFAAEDPAQLWGGLKLWTLDTGSHTSRLHHVVVRDLLGGIYSDRLELRNARVERACQGGSPCAAVEGTSYGGITLEDVVINSSGATGVSPGGRRSDVSLVRVRIQNSAGLGLTVGTDNVSLSAEDVRIVGGATYPARIPAKYLESIAGSRSAVDRLIGNARDTLLITVHDLVAAPMTVYRDLPWRLFGSMFGNPPTLVTPTITLEAGASVTIEHHEIRWRVGRMIAAGTEADPVVIAGGNLDWSRVGDPVRDTVRLTHTILRDVDVGSSSFSRGGVALEMDGVAAHRSRIWIGSGSTGRLRNSALDSSIIAIRSADAVLENVTLRGSPPDAIRVDSGTVTITGCEIRGGEGHALHVSEAASAGTSITGCNLAGNAGFGVNNLSPFTVDASGNWWGDPAGPEGPEGDGAAGSVIVQPVRTSPVQR